MKYSRVLLILLLLTSERSLAAAPSWSKDQTVKQTGRTVVVTCSGSGIAKDIAFQNAIHQCGSIAANVANSAFTSKSVVIETESQSPKLYSEISSEKQVVGLQPTTEREFTESSDEGFTTYLQTRYDLSTAKVSNASDQAAESPGSDQQSSVEAPPQDKPSAQIKTERTIVGSDRTITISMLPEKCADYIVRGKNPRTFPCKTNPMQVMVNVASDDEIILRPTSNAFLPKTLKVRRQRGPASDYESEVIDVMFERH